MKLLGREPALWLALIAAGVKLTTAFGAHVTANQQAAINTTAAAVVAVIIAFMVHDGVGAAILGFVQAALAAAVGFGLHWSADRQAIVMSTAAAVVAMWTRTQVTAPVPPVSRPTLTAAPPAQN